MVFNCKYQIFSLLLWQAQLLLLDGLRLEQELVLLVGILLLVAQKWVGRLMYGSLGLIVGGCRNLAEGCMILGYFFGLCCKCYCGNLLPKDLIVCSTRICCRSFLTMISYYYIEYHVNDK